MVPSKNYDFDVLATFASAVPDGSLTVTKEQLFIFLPQLVVASSEQLAFHFEVTNLEDGNFLLRMRWKNDDDYIMLKEYNKSI